MARSSMDIILPLIPILLITCVLGFFVFTYYKSQALDPLEKGLNPLYETTCTAYFDGIKRNFTRFTIYNEFLVIGSLKKTILKFDEIKSVVQERIYFCKCLTIHHNNKSKPSISLLISDLEGPKKLIDFKMNKI